MVGMLVALTLACQPQVVKAQNVPSSPAMAVSISNGVTSVSILLQASQNLTSQYRLFSLPQFNGQLVGQNASTVSSIVQDSIKALSPRATVSNLRLALSSSPSANGTVLQWFNVSLQFQVGGVQTPENGDERTDLSWKSFVIASNVTIGGVEVNTVGSTYMRGAAAFLQALETPSQGTFAFRNLINNRVVTPIGLPSAISRIQLLNFTRFLPPVDTWQQSYDFSSRSTLWSLVADPNLGLIVQQTSTEPHATTEKSTSGFFYVLKAAISAPSRSLARGNTVLAVFQDTSEAVMAMVGTVIVVMVALGAATFLYERRVLRNRIGRKPKH